MSSSFKNVCVGTDAHAIRVLFTRLNDNADRLVCAFIVVAVTTKTVINFRNYQSVKIYKLIFFI